MEEKSPFITAGSTYQVKGGFVHYETKSSTSVPLHIELALHIINQMHQTHSLPVNQTPFPSPAMTSITPCAHLPPRLPATV